MRYLTPSILLGIALSLLIGTNAFAYGGHDGERDKDRKPKWIEKLNLTDAQQEELKKIRESHGDKMKDKRQVMKDAKKALQQAMQSDATESALWTEFNKLHTLRADFAKARFEKVLAIRAILTPEQRKEFKGMKGHRRHHGPRGGGGRE